MNEDEEEGGGKKYWCGVCGMQRPQRTNSYACTTKLTIYTPKVIPPSARVREHNLRRAGVVVTHRHAPPQRTPSMFAYVYVYTDE